MISADVASVTKRHSVSLNHLTKGSTREVTQFAIRVPLAWSLSRE